MNLSFQRQNSDFNAQVQMFTAAQLTLLYFLWRLPAEIGDDEWDDALFTQGTS